MHLHSYFGYGRPMGDIQYVYSFSALALFVLLIACINFMNLSTARSTRRAREIGLRKVVGASVAGIVLLLTRDFTKWVLVANAVAWPLAWYAMDRWLEGFAYRVDVSWTSFALAGGLALGIAWLTVSWQAVKAATADPVKALRYE